MAQEPRKSELIAELATARAIVSTNVRHLGRELNVVQHVKTNFAHHRVAWLGGAGILGLLVARLSSRRKPVPAPIKRGNKNEKAEKTIVEAGLAVTVLKFAFDLVRPALTKWLARRIADYAAERFDHGARV